MTRSIQTAATAAAVILSFCLSTLGQAELIDRGGGMIYDTALDITWSQDANMAGIMIWDDAFVWADTLVFGGFDDWRLPSMDVNGDHMATGDFDNGIVNCATATELECRDNELGYMYYHNLGGTGNLSGNQGLFTNIRIFHWSGTEFLPIPNAAWVFSFGGGAHGVFDLNDAKGAWAVRDGDGDVDTDQDGINNNVDNCLLAANPLQRDTDSDGIGNFCDPDVAIPNDCTVNFLDLTAYQDNFLVAGDLDTDNNGDEQTNFLDLIIAKGFFFGPPGPSANGCN